jgi:hypothetical protein
MTRHHGLVARFLLVVSLVGATTVHHHSILEDASSARIAVPVLDARCAVTKSLSLHAISRIVEREACWACHWHRGFAVPTQAALPERVSSSRSLGDLPTGAVDHVAAFTLTARGPPSPLSL